MNQQKLFTCQDISHENDDILGFCLNLGCKDSRSQFCLQCSADPIKHANCRKDLKGFNQMKSLMTKFQENLLNLTTQLNKSFAQIKTKYEEYQKQMEIMNKQLVKLSESLTQQDYLYIKQNLYSLKEWGDDKVELNWNLIIYIYHYFLIINNVKKMIKALNLDQQQQSSESKSLQQDQENKLQREKENNILYQICRNGNRPMNYSQKCQSNQKNNHLLLHSFNVHQYLIIFLGQGFILREYAKKINKNLYRDLLDFSDLEIKKNPRNTFMIIAKRILNLTDEKKYQQAIEQCDNVLNEQPQHLHALYRKNTSLQLNQQLQLQHFRISMQKLQNALIKRSNIIQIIVLVISRKGIRQKQELDGSLQKRRINRVMHLFAMMRLFNQILIIHKPQVVKVFNQNKLIFIYQYLILENIKKQLLAMIRLFNQILILQQPIIIKVFHQIINDQFFCQKTSISRTKLYKIIAIQQQLIQLILKLIRIKVIYYKLFVK